MAVKVIDASALGALLFGEPDGAAVAERLRQAELIAPALLSFAVANVCLKKMRRHPDQRDALVPTASSRMVISSPCSERW